MVKGWVAEFKVGQTTITDNPCVGRPIEVITPEKIDKIVMMDRGMKVSELDETVGISTEHVHNTSHERSAYDKYVR